jgi:hypothetical protein
MFYPLATICCLAEVYMIASNQDCFTYSLLQLGRPVIVLCGCLGISMVFLGREERFWRFWFFS